MKPTFGQVAAYPASAFGTLAHVGPLARSAEDAKLMLDAMAGRDLADWNQPPVQYARRDLRPLDFRGLKIGYWRTPPCGALDAEVGGACDAAVKRLAAAGAEVEPLTLPDAGLLELFNTLWLASATRRVRSVPEPRRSLIDPNLIEAVKRFEGDSAVDYVDASVRRVEFASWMEALFERFDLVVSPAVTVPPFDKGRDFPVGSGMKIWTEWAGFSFPVNLSQQPACVVPCARTRDERPIGLQFIAARAADDRVLEAAAAYRALAA